MKFNKSKKIKCCNCYMTYRNYVLEMFDLHLESWVQVRSFSDINHCRAWFSCMKKSFPTMHFRILEVKELF